MPKSDDSPEAQIAKLKAMLRQNEDTAKQMRELIEGLEAKTKDSKDKKRGNQLSSE